MVPTCGIFSLLVVDASGSLRPATSFLGGTGGGLESIDSLGLRIWYFVEVCSVYAIVEV